MAEKTAIIDATPSANLDRLRALLAHARELAGQLFADEAGAKSDLLGALHMADDVAGALGGQGPAPEKQVLVLEIPDRQVNMLQVLSAGLQLRESPADEDIVDLKWAPEKALHELLERLNDGVHRPGSWEHAHVRAFFGEDWLSFMERDPKASHRLRPRETT